MPMNKQVCKTCFRGKVREVRTFGRAETGTHRQKQVGKVL